MNSAVQNGSTWRYCMVVVHGEVQNEYLVIVHNA